MELLALESSVDAWSLFTTQDIKGDASDPLKKGATALLSTCSTSDALQSGALTSAGQGDGEGGDVSKKDKVITAFHSFCFLVYLEMSHDIFVMWSWSSFLCYF